MLSKFFSRRDFFQSGSLGSLLASLGIFRGRLSAGALKIGPNLFESIGVRPLVNCKGTYTIISGSQSLPEVKAAMEAASHHYVHLDELMEAVGKRLAELTQAEWGMVSNGCAAALAHATAACMAGADPEKMQRLSQGATLKNEVIAPAYSRNVYDHAVRGAGARFVDVHTLDEYKRAFNDRTAMVMVLAGPGDRGELGLQVLAPIAREHGVPVLVDAAAERLKVPNIHLAAGADLVAYSGGKCLRGPQAAGLLLGRKDLIKAAWLNSAPHHAFGRPMKACKEEIMGMLAAVEMWMKRDHDAEWKQWESWLDTISKSVTRVAGVTTKVIQPDSLSNNAPQLRIIWDGEALGISGEDAEKALLNGEPRIILGGASGGRRNGVKNSSLTIMPYMMMPGDADVAARRIHEVLAHPAGTPVHKPSPPAVNLSGQWDVEMEYVVGKAHHRLAFEQHEGELAGTHFGEFLHSDLRGTVDGSEVWFRSSHKFEGTRIGYEFLGQAAGDTITGEANLGEYGTARFTARRHQYGRPGGVVRPVKTV
ncbi:MAG: aminotransferase class V-fold PLP-dependent enzyme [Bryobacterales bacterium]|nr:aminotransferase class V-fold PLP-dependent enzyme [Bryobacterales bacterium]